MKRIRLGNDINIAWSVFRNGQPEEFSGKELTLLMSNEYRTQELTDYEVHDHVISFAFCGKDQKSLGTYSLTLIENNGEEGMYTLDACDAFRLVARSCMEGGESSEGLSVETVQLSGDLAVPANGLSAYELAVKHGFVGTEQEWLASLKGPKGDALTYEDLTPAQIAELQKPATDAADKALQSARLADAATENAVNATKAAELAIIAIGETDKAISEAERLRVSAENTRVSNENERESNESSRKSAEQSRVSEEQTRVQNEQTRQSDETQRQTAETQRNEAEQSRATEFATLKKESETATQSATEAAQNANQAVEDMAAEFAKKQDVLISGENIKTVNGIDVLGNGNIVINPTIMDLKWTTNVATTRKLVPAELRSKGVKIAYRDASNVYHVEQYQSEVIDDASWAADSNWKGCRTPMTPLFENAGATFNDETGFYELNGLVDIDENEMNDTYNISNLSNISYPFTGTLTSNRTRTNIPVMYDTNNGYDWLISSEFCRLNTKIEICVLGTIAVKPFRSTFEGCVNLRAIKRYADRHDTAFGDINFNSGASIKLFTNCKKLEEVNVSNVKSSMEIFKDSPLINYASVEFLVRKAVNTGPITLTINPTTYGYLTGTIEPTEQVGGTKEEWMQIVTDAQAKQITFATE